MREVCRRAAVIVESTPKHGIFTTITLAIRVRPAACEYPERGEAIVIGRLSRNLFRRTRMGRRVDITPAQPGRERQVGVLALAGLVRALLSAPIRRVSIAESLHLWLRSASGHGECPALSFGIGSRRVLVVTGRGFSAHILAEPPHERAYVEGRLKRSAMAFLAPNALTVSHGEEWVRRRAFNERILQSGTASAARAAYLSAVRSAFEAPLESEDDIRERMRSVMLDVVGGPNLPRSLARDIDTLIAIVNNPLRRLTIGRFAGSTRQRFYGSLRNGRDYAPTTSSLLGHLLEDSADGAGGLDADEALEQVPHWMFPFSGSATDLLTRTLVMIGSRPDVWLRIEQELATAGEPGDPSSVDRLPFIEACILETGRLFPPVTRTFHTAPTGDTFDGIVVTPGAEIVHLFPLIERTSHPELASDEFQPERWLGAPNTRPHSNLFLSGARACPGRDLIIFILKGAVESHVAGHRRHFFSVPLANDPLPYTFPRRSIEIISGTPAPPVPGVADLPTTSL